MSEPATTEGPSPFERKVRDAVLADPIGFPQEFTGWLEEQIRLQLTAKVIRALVPVYAVGDPRIITKDLTAETGVYVYEDALGQFLYMNGATANQADYPALYAYWGANAWGTDPSGSTFLLGDSRGRSLFFCGTHANTDLGDNDGEATVANRQAKHSHASTDLTVTGAPSAGTLAISNGTSQTKSGVGGAGYTVVASDPDAADPQQYVTVGLTGAPGLGTLDVGGTAGTGTAGDAPAHLFIGSLLVRF